MSAVARRATGADLPAVTALQQAAYARNREILGVEPLPLLADYAEVFTDYEVWLYEAGGALAGVLILESRLGDLLIWSIATVPGLQKQGLGAQMLAAAEGRARELGLACLRLYTGQRLSSNIAWYERHGYAIEREELMGDRIVVHMLKNIGDTQWQDA
jgi:ribosomal protein S18 acetylase RimI-like enzyme